MTSKQADDWPQQIGGVELRPRSESGGDDSRDAEDQPHPPRCKNAPAEGKQRWRIGVEYGRVADGEVFNADPCRHLVVANAVDDGGHDAQQDDLQPFHAVGLHRFRKA